MRHCIVHRELIDATVAAGKICTLADWNRAYSAQMTIEDALAANPDAVVLDLQEDPANVISHFRRGDRVTLYGAYLGGCLKTAYDSLKAKGVEVKYHPDGCIEP